MRGDALRAAIANSAPAHRDVLTTVSRALEVLEAVAASPRPLPAKAVAGRLGLSLGTSYHVLHTLEQAGYVVRLGHGRYGLGGKVPELYRLFHDRLDLVPRMRPFLAELAERTHEDTYLAVLRDSEVVVAEVVEGSRELHLDGLGVGFSRVAHSSALGKVLLASVPEDVVDDYLSERPLASFTRRTLVQRRHIKRHVAVVRELGVGNDLEELAEGCCCVAVPLTGPRGDTMASIGLSCPTARWRREREQLTRLVRDAGARASAALRGDGRSGLPALR